MTASVLAQIEDAPEGQKSRLAVLRSAREGRPEQKHHTCCAATVGLRQWWKETP
ncbi:hypothetical protein J2Z19_002530 [Ensifer adhaerens]|uniref:Uncharacterized protein n=1 Tax=Ensifer adhaerens TaxID=106592 RepID=A0ACC5SVA8_ENSAD|nr:hypothetical protein [Ensifer adhaerens]MBP1872818.1 hypothetical protein [Ensifer adhaerens]